MERERDLEPCDEGGWMVMGSGTVETVELDWCDKDGGTTIGLGTISGWGFTCAEGELEATIGGACTVDTCEGTCVGGRDAC